MLYDDRILSIRDDVASFSVEQSIDINTLFNLQIARYLDDGDVLLDVGTGNGFVLSEILQNNDKQIRLVGVDNSREMVMLARENLVDRAEIVEASNDGLPFSDGSFDIVTAKNVTRINALEIFRVLKDDGVFIFREYGFGKGMIEIAKMFAGRIIRQREAGYYIELLLKAGFQIIYFEQYEIWRKYDSADKLASVVKSFPFVENFSELDERIILEEFAKNATITSDPFVLVAKKLKGSKEK